VVSEISLTESGYLPDDGQSYIISIQYFFDRMAVCAITFTGDILLWDVTTNEVCILFNVFLHPDLDEYFLTFYCVFVAGFF